MHGDLIIRGPTETSRASQPFALSFQGPSTVPPLYTQTSRAQSPLNPSSSRQIFPYSLSSPLTCVRVRGNLRLHYCVYFYDIAFLKSHFDVMIWNFLWLQFRINSVSSVSKSCLWIQQTFLIINNVYLTQLHLKNAYKNEHIHMRNIVKMFYFIKNKTHRYQLNLNKIMTMFSGYYCIRNLYG